MLDFLIGHETLKSDGAVFFFRQVTSALNFVEIGWSFDECVFFRSVVFLSFKIFLGRNRKEEEEDENNEKF